MIISIKLICTDYLGLKKEVELEPEQVKALNSQYSYDEIIKRITAAANSYSKNYWVKALINDKEVYHVQWAQL